MRRFLRHLEGSPKMAGPQHVLAQRIGAEAVAALLHEGVLTPAGSANALPCPRGYGGCHRIVARHPGQRLPYLALCGAATTECISEPMSEEQVAQVALSMPALLGLLRRLLAIDGTSVDETHDSAFSFELGAREGRPVVFCRGPREPELGRLRRRRPDALVVVPSSSHVFTSTHRLFDYKSAKAPLLSLDNLLFIEDGRVRAAGVPKASLRCGRLVVPRGTSWREVEMYALNDDVVAIRVGDAAPVACTPGDLGMVREWDRRSTVHWQSFLALCAGRGVHAS